MSISEATRAEKFATQNFCLEKVKTSKWTDVALLTGFVVLLFIGLLVTAGIFNFIGTNNAALLSYVMYGGAALFLLAEIIKVAINGCSEKIDNSSVTPVKTPSQKEILNLKKQVPDPTDFPPRIKDPFIVLQDIKSDLEKHKQTLEELKTDVGQLEENSKEILNLIAEHFKLSQSQLEKQLELAKKNLPA